MKNTKIPDYPFIMNHLNSEEGGGYYIEFPDLPGCISDGESIEETLKNGREAVICWIDAAKEIGRSIPKPGDFEKQSGRWVQRAPKSIHLRLAGRAKEEGVSLNTLVVSILSEGLSKYRMSVPSSKTMRTLKK
jgi:antitoxin HicB